MFKYGLFGNGYDKEGFNKYGYDKEGYDKEGFNSDGYDRSGYDRAGFSINGYNRNGYDVEGFDRCGYNKEGYDRHGFDAKGYDHSGYDRAGFNIYGYNQKGYDKNGFDMLGYDAEGYNQAGFNKTGYDRYGFNQFGYNGEGYDRRGFDVSGYDRAGYDRDGYDEKGYDRNGFNRDGYDKEGYNKRGYNAQGYDRNGQVLPSFNPKSQHVRTIGRTEKIDAIQIGLASPEKIRSWSSGEVKKPETINYRTLKPEPDGLFCEKIFGPTKDWECHCGKYKRVRYKGVVCDRCGVEVTHSKVRRERMGHIELAAPVSHIWYFEGISSPMCLLLDMSPRLLEKVLYFAAYIVIDPGRTALMKNQILTEKEYREECEKYGADSFRAGMGAEAILEMLREIDLEKLYAELKADLDGAKGQKKIRTVRRLEVIEAFRQSGNKLEWMILTVIPVIPPDIRPMVQLDGERFATSDLNDLYRKVININNCLKRRIEIGYPEVIIRNEKRLLQEAVDALIDNGRRGRPVVGPGNRPLKSLSDMLKGKQGRFRQNLLGKRVDYSGRSVIVVGPELKIYQCGLPKKMALELFKPFVMKRLVQDGLAHNIKSAKRMVERVRPEVWAVLEEVISEHPVLLHCNPTPDKLGIRAFEPVLVEEKVIKIHPLVCASLRTDLDRNEIAVHLPLSPEAQAEARILMLSANNLLNPQNGEVVTVPDKDIVLGCYYLTIKVGDEVGAGKAFSSTDEAILAYENGVVGIHAPIKVLMTKEINGKRVREVIDATVGRLIFNEKIPQDLGFVDRSYHKNTMVLEIDFLVDNKAISEIIKRCIKVHGVHKTAIILDEIKTIGFKYSTKSGISIGISDMKIPIEKGTFIKEAEKSVDTIMKQFNSGYLSNEERQRFLKKTWAETTDNITYEIMENIEELNPIHIMEKAGSCNSIKHIAQIAGMRGYVTGATGEMFEYPIKSNLREGLSTLEYFASTYDARKRHSYKDIDVNDALYLTRRLIDVTHAVTVCEYDCGVCDGIEISAITEGIWKIEPLEKRLSGRYPANNIVSPDTHKVLATPDDLIDEQLAKKIVASGVTKAKVRSILTCRSKNGVCAKCYGSSITDGNLVSEGEAVGIIAAQSVGGPFVKRMMNFSDTDGTECVEALLDGLSQIEGLFEARKPNNPAIIAEIGGRVQLSENKKKRDVSIIDDKKGNVVTYTIPYGSRIIAVDGEMIEAGDAITGGSINLHDILAIKGYTAIQNYLIQEVQRVYRRQGVDINDKHIEVIVGQMMRKVRIEDSGDSKYLTGTLVDRYELEEANNILVNSGKAPATYEDILMGITNAALATDSFLSAASFQETVSVLTNAAIKRKIDMLIGLKENVIIGNLIPVGTGIAKYQNTKIERELPVIPVTEG